MVRIILLVVALVVASSACGGDDGDDAPTDVDAGATEDQAPSPDDDGAPPEGDDQEAARGATSPPCYVPMEITGPADEEAPEFEATTMGNIPMEEVGAELESILEGIDGLACPERPEGSGLGHAHSRLVLDDGIAIDAESELYVSLDVDTDDPSTYDDELMTVCQELSSFLAEHEDAVGTATIDIDLGADSEYEPLVRNETVAPGDPGTCTTV